MSESPAEVAESVSAMQDVEFTPAPPRETDEHNRVIVSLLTDREIAEELLSNVRLLADLINQVGSNPMLAKMFPMASLTGR